MFAANGVLCSSAIVPPENINRQLVVCVVHQLIDRTLCAPLPTTRQQLVEAKAGTNPLACTSTAPQLKLAG